MISVTDLRAGTTFEDNGQIYQVLSYEHIKMGRGTATIKVKVKNLRTGSITEKSFISSARVDQIPLLKKEMQFLYKDDKEAFFMDPVIFEQISVPLRTITQPQLLKEGGRFTLNFYNQEPLEVIFSPKMEFKVLETGPGERGNSATNIYKDAILENGLKVRVPLFIKTGDRVLIDTRTLIYHEKAKAV